MGPGGTPAARIAIVATGVTICLGFVCAVFWHEDVRYSLPTPRPAGLVQVARGEKLPVERWLAEAKLPVDGRPLLFHFFNPYCPCSRFNLEHIRQLRRRFEGRVRFVGVVEAPIDDPGARTDLERRLAELHFDLPYAFDPDGHMAREAGVYSTPQGVLVQSEGALVYRGNYNVSRYCTDPRTEFVRIALESLVDQKGEAPPDAPAYGCKLPSTERTATLQTWAWLSP
jgi:hypothetical protein